MRARHRDVGGAAGLLAVLEADGMAELVQRGRYTDVQKKIDGRWLYTVDHPSDDPPPSP